MGCSSGHARAFTYRSGLASSDAIPVTVEENSLFTELLGSVPLDRSISINAASLTLYHFSS